MGLADLAGRVGKRYDRDVVQTIATQTALLGAALAVSVVTARTLGPAGRGEFFFITTIAALVAQFGNFGLVTTNTFVVAKKPRLLGALTANSLVVALAVTLATALLATGLGGLLSPPRSLLYLAAAIGGARLFQLLAVNLLAGVQRFRSFNLFQVIGGAVLISAVLVGAIRGTVTSFLWAMLLAAVLTGLVVAGFIHGLSRLPTKFSGSLYAGHLSFSARSYLIHLLGFLMLRGNVLLMEKLSSMAELGYYSIGTQIFEAIGVIPAAIALVLYPRLVARSGGGFRYMLGYLVAVTAVLAVVCLVAGVVVKPAVAWVFGTDFVPAAAPTLWLLPGALLVGMHAVVAQYLAAEGQPASILGSWAVAIAVMAALGFVQIPERGAVGAAISLSIGYGVLLAANLGLAGALAYRAARSERSAGGRPDG